METTNKNTTHPAHELNGLASHWGLALTSAEFATRLDERDDLKAYREQFCVPRNATLPGVDLSAVNPEDECIYFAGNSLGLLAKNSRKYINRELDRWEYTAIHGHFNNEFSWALCDEVIQGDMATVVGAQRDEVVVMNALTVNQHILLISFYAPTSERHKIVMEKGSFPSDLYVAESQVRLHGFKPEESIILLEPREGEETLRTEDILAVLDREGESVALVMLPGVQYYTGQLFDMKAITEAAHCKGCMVGFDLAHAVANVPLYLHAWEVDFAVWCSYKYLCSGAGGIGGAFIHAHHAENTLPKLAGWWSHRFDTRFDMKNEFEPSTAPACYRLSNPSKFLTASLQAPLELYVSATMPALRAKSLLLTAFLELLLKHYFSAEERADRPHVDILTPSDPEQRGCQLSLTFSIPVSHVHQQLSSRGVQCDMRKPNVIRVAPKPIYNSFRDVHKFVAILLAILHEEYTKNTHDVN